jgi:MscS family membrane protein
MIVISRTARVGRSVLFVMIAMMAWASGATSEEPAMHPLEPPDRSSPRATLTTFLDSIDRAWELYSAGDPGFDEPFRDARECLDLSQIPPLVFQEVSAESALVLKEVLDRIELPVAEQIPDAAAVSELGISRWTIPHTEITLVHTLEGERKGEWLFSSRTVARAEEYFDRVRHLPYLPGKAGGHVEELRSGSNAFLLMKLVELMPRWFRGEVGGMLAWQWFGLALLVALLALAVLATAWLSRRWRGGRLPGRSLTSYLLPLAMIAVPFVGGFMIRRIFALPGAPALIVRLLLSIVGYLGLAWLVALLLTHFGDLIVGTWFRDARPLKKQLVRVVFRIATIVAVTVIAVLAMQRLGVPVAGLIAGLGVGGLAIALAAQGTLENFIGGVILYADQPVRVGDFCKFGDRRGVVEDVGLRSVKIRTLDRTIVTVPNADFAKLQLENLAERDRVLLRENLRLRYETTRKQLQAVMAELESMLKEHERLAEEPLRVRFIGFGEYYLEIELYAYAMTDAWPQFLEIREDVLLKVMNIVERSGTRLALPTEIHYQGGQVVPGERSGSDFHAT